MGYQSIGAECLYGGRNGRFRHTQRGGDIRYARVTFTLLKVEYGAKIMFQTGRKRTARMLWLWSHS